MTEAELFVELLDDRELTNLIKHFKIPMVGGFRIEKTNTQKKRQAIKTAIKITPIGKRKKVDLAVEIMNRYTISKIKDVPEDSYLAVLSELKSPEHVKYAYTYTHHYAIFKDIFPDLLAKFQSGATVLFDYSETLDNDEDAIRIVKSLHLIDTDEYANYIINKVEGKLTPSQKESLTTIIEQVKSLAFYEFVRKKKELEETYNESLLLLAYAKSNKTLDESIRNQYAFDALMGIVDDTRATFFERGLNTLEEIKETQAELEKERKECAKLQKQQLTLTSQMESLQEEFETYKQGESSRFEKLERQYQEDLARLVKDREKVLEGAEKEASKYQEVVKSLLEMISTWAGDHEPYSEFAVIYSQETRLLLELYPEITAYSIQEWKKYETELETYPVIYVQRDGCSSAQLSLIRKAFPEIRIFNAGGDKQLIEHIEEIKKKEGVLYVTV